MGIFALNRIRKLGGGDWWRGEEAFGKGYKGACVLSHFSHVQPCATIQTVARQVPLSIGFSRQEYWSGLLCPPPGDLSNPGSEAKSSMSPELAGGFFTTSTTWEAPQRGLLSSRGDLGSGLHFSGLGERPGTCGLESGLHEEVRGNLIKNRREEAV